METPISFGEYLGKLARMDELRKTIKSLHGVDVDLSKRSEHNKRPFGPRLEAAVIEYFELARSAKDESTLCDAVIPIIGDELLKDGYSDMHVLGQGDERTVGVLRKGQFINIEPGYPIMKARMASADEVPLCGELRKGVPKLVAITGIIDGTYRSGVITPDMSQAIQDLQTRHNYRNVEAYGPPDVAVRQILEVADMPLERVIEMQGNMTDKQYVVKMPCE